MLWPKKNLIKTPAASNPVSMPALIPGLQLYRQAVGFYEKIEVMALQADGLGIPHVKFRQVVGAGPSQHDQSGCKTLALEAFAARYGAYLPI